MWGHVGYGNTRGHGGLRRWKGSEGLWKQGWGMDAERTQGPRDTICKWGGYGDTKSYQCTEKKMNGEEQSKGWKEDLITWLDTLGRCPPLLLCVSRYGHLHHEAGAEIHMNHIFLRKTKATRSEPCSSLFTWPEPDSLCALRRDSWNAPPSPIQETWAPHPSGSKSSQSSEHCVGAQPSASSCRVTLFPAPF